LLSEFLDLYAAEGRDAKATFKALIRVFCIDKVMVEVDETLKSYCAAVKQTPAEAVGEAMDDLKECTIGAFFECHPKAMCPSKSKNPFAN
jgi:hypothetical protein